MTLTKPTLIIAILLLFSSKSFAQNIAFADKTNYITLSVLVNNYDSNQIHSKFSVSEFNTLIKEASTPHPLVKTGKILTFIGIPLAIVGGIMVANSDALYYECINGVCDGDPQGGFGILLLASGVGMTGTGIVLWTIGKKR